MQKIALLTLIGVAATGFSGVAAAWPDPAAPLPAAASKPHLPRVSRVDVVAEDGWVRVVVESSKPIVPKVFSVRRPAHAVVVDFSGVWSGRSTTRRIRRFGVTQVRYGQFDKTHMRVVVNATRALEWKVSPSARPGTWEILVAEPGHPLLGNDAIAIPGPSQPGPVSPGDPATPPANVPPVTRPTPTVKPVAPKPTVVGSDGSETTPTRTPPKVTPVPPTPKPPVPVDPANRKVSLDFVAAEIGDVLKALSLQSGINVVAGPTAKGAITVSLKDITLREAMDWITRLTGLRYSQEGNTFVVGSGKEIAQLSSQPQVGQTVSASISFHYAEGGSLEKSILAVFPNVNVTFVTINPEARKNDPAPGGIASPFPGNPAIPSGPDATSMAAPGLRGGVANVVGSRAEVDAVRSFIEEVEQSMIKAADRDLEEKSARIASQLTEILPVRHVNPWEVLQLLREQVPGLTVRIGPQQRLVGNPSGGSITFGGGGAAGSGGGSAGFTGAGGGVGLPSGAGTGLGSSGASGGNLQAMQASTASVLVVTGRETDVQRARDLVKKLDQRSTQFSFEAEVYDVNSDDVGQFGLAYDLSKPIGVGENDPTNGNNAGNPGRNLGFGTILRTPFSVTTQLQAMVKANKAKVLARPKLIGQDNLPAVAFIGDQFNYVVNIQQTAQGQNVTTETATVGITLRVTGKANGDGTITLYVHPEVSTITSFLTVGAYALPQTSTRFVDTTIRVKDGETIAIGGLVRSEEFQNRQYVPFLGQLPVIGKLFSTSSKQTRKSEVMVFLTCRTLKD